MLFLLAGQSLFQAMLHIYVKPHKSRFYMWDVGSAGGAEEAGRNKLNNCSNDYKPF